MNYHKLVVLPTPSTIQYLLAVFDGSPTQIEWDVLHVVLGTSKTRGLTDDSAVYQAFPGAMGQWYDPAEARTKWLLPLIPNGAMAERHEKVGDVFSRQFVPYMMLTSLANNRHRTKAFMNSVAESLINERQFLEFGAELWVQADGVVPEDSEFYNDYLRRGGLSNMALLADDQDTE